LYVLLGIYEYSRFIMLRQLLDSAVREGARYAVVHTYDKTAKDVQDRVFQALARQDSQLKNVTVQVFRADPVTGANLGPWTDASFGECIAVQITGDYSPLVPTFLCLAKTMPLQAIAIMYSEAN
jgi:Flp pilus assembly protein TadG